MIQYINILDSIETDNEMRQQKMSFFSALSFSIWAVQSVSPSSDIPLLSLGPRRSQCTWPHPKPLLYHSSDGSLHPDASTDLRQTSETACPAALEYPTLRYRVVACASLRLLQSHGAFMLHGCAFFAFDIDSSRIHFFTMANRTSPQFVFTMACLCPEWPIWRERWGVPACMHA